MVLTRLFTAKLQHPWLGTYLPELISELTCYPETNCARRREADHIGKNIYTSDPIEWRSCPATVFHFQPKASEPTIRQPSKKNENTMSTPLAVKMRQTTDAFVQAWEEWKVEPVMAVRAPECLMLQFPTSLQIPERDNDSFRKWFGGVDTLLSNCKVRRFDEKITERYTTDAIRSDRS